MDRSEPRDAIVTDGLWRLSVSAIRALGKAGYRVTVLGEGALTTGFWSRYADRRVSLPSAEADPAGFGERLLRLLNGYAAPPVIAPMTDGSVRWLVDNAAAASRRARFLVPTAEAYRVARDKAATARLAEELGVPAPKTWSPATADELVEVVAALPAGEFVVKPREGRGSAGLVYGERLAADEWRRRWEKFGALLVQSRIPPGGDAVGVSLLFDGGGRCCAAFAHKRLREYPVRGGPSTDRESIALPEPLLADSRRMLEHLGWRGVAMCEWKHDPRSGRYQLLEINPRFWGSLELAVRAGVNFPVLYAEAASGGAPAPVFGGRPGVRCRWLIPGELLRWAGSPPDEREPLRAFLRGLPGLAEEWDPDDKRGAIASAVCTAALAFHPRYWKYALPR